MTQRAVTQQQRFGTATQTTTRPSLAFNVRVNVAVIGGGITGLTAAYLLKRAGRTVALLERARCGSGETGRTSAHLTAVPDRSLMSLVDSIGLDRTQVVWDAGFAAVARVRAIVRDERINCGFAWVSGYLHASHDEPRVEAHDRIRQETEIARALGIDASYAEDVSGIAGPALVFENQARLHPLRYLGVLADRIDGDGSYVFEGTHVDAVDGDGPILVRSGPYRVTADSVVVATHAPMADAVGPHDYFATRLKFLTTYAVSGVAPRGLVSEGLYWDGRDASYEHLRVDRHTNHDEVCLGGGDQLAADDDRNREDILEMLARRLQRRIAGVRVTNRWAGEVIETDDGLPYIGEYSMNRFAATGFAGNGLTYGTLGGMLAADALTGRLNPWREVFDVRRAEPKREETCLQLS